MRKCILFVISILMAVALSACTPASSQSPSPTPPAGQPALSPTAGVTYVQLAQAGQNVYNRSCGDCHGVGGAGGKSPAVTGQDAQLNKFKTAEGLLKYTTSAMPMRAAGSLTRQEYLEVTAYMLVGNNYVPSDTLYNENQLSSITLP